MNDELGAIELDPTNRIVVRRTHHKGETYADVRRFWKPEGEFVATKKGVAIKLGDVPRLIEALQKVAATNEVQP